MTVCYDCRAYDHPHRMGGGKCQRTNHREPYCINCGSHELRLADHGVGFTEAWGVVDRDVQWVVECIECDGGEIRDPETGRLMSGSEYRRYLREAAAEWYT